MASRWYPCSGPEADLAPTFILPWIQLLGERAVRSSATFTQDTDPASQCSPSRRTSVFTLPRSPSWSLNPHASLHLPGQWLVWPHKLIPEQGCPYQATGSLSPSSPPWILSSLVSKEPAHTSPKLFPSFSLTALQAPETNVPKDKQTFSKVVLFCLTPCEFIFCHFFY